ncbi:MAG: FkbM family methyltransferase [Patescibacteria group bacterium]
MTTLFSIIPSLARLLSGGSLYRQLRIAATLYYFILSRKMFKQSQNDIKLNSVFNSREITFYLKYPMDIAVLREVFIDNEYAWCPIENPKVIVDLGAHFGDTTLYYNARFPDATVIAVEPSPENYSRLVKHTAAIANIKPVQAAVGGSNGTIELNIGSSSLGHSVLARKDSHHSVTVPLITLTELFEKNAIAKADLIKFDVEGAEFDIFKSINPADYATAYIGEIHFDLGTVTKDEFEYWFKDFTMQWTQIRTDRYLFNAEIK